MAYPVEIYERAKKVLADRKNRAEEDRRRRHSEVCEKFPEIKVLEREMAALSAESVKAIAASRGSVTLVDELAKKSLEIQKERKKILTDNGYAPDYLDVKYTCPLCSDTGYAGEYVCECYKNTVRELALEELSRTAPAKGSDFESFKLSYYPEEYDSHLGVSPRQHMERVLSFCKSYAEEFDKHTSAGLIFYGLTGLGKTHLSLAIATVVTKRGYNVIYYSVPELMNKLNGEYFRREGGQDTDTFEKICECDLLILDDLGTEFQTSFTNSMFYSVINRRILSSLPTIISTNLDGKSLEEKYSQRICSRFIGNYEYLGFCGKDVRQLKRHTK